MDTLKIDLTALILSTVCVTEDDGHPMTATEVAFLLDVPQDETDLSLSELIADGSIKRRDRVEDKADAVCDRWRDMRP
jgi:hypothetical protein